MKNPYRFLGLAALILVFLLQGCMHKVEYKEVSQFTNQVSSWSADSKLPLMAGMAKVDITPKGRVWMAGFGSLRPNRDGVHDPLFARVLVLKQGDKKLVLVSVDTIGIQRTDVLTIKGRVSGYNPDDIIIASTHTHSGSDTIGFWGYPPLLSGQDKKYMARLGSAISTAIGQADRTAESVSVWASLHNMDSTIMFNVHTGEPRDDSMGIISFRDAQGKTVATLINLAGHPEVMWKGNRSLSADYPGPVLKMTEDKFGGGAIFFNADLGAMMTPNLPQTDDGRDWKTLEKVASQVFSEVDKGMDLLVRDEEPVLSHQTANILVPVKNERYILAVKFGLLKREVFTGDMLMTDIHVFEIGQAQFVTFPGEAYPKLGLKVRAKQKALSFQIGLADDELGYILYQQDYGSLAYSEESEDCVGPGFAAQIEQELTGMLGKK